MLKNFFSISWWRQSINGLTVANFHQRWSQIVTVFHNPQINPIMFLMIIAVIVVAVLIAVLTVLMIITAASRRRDRYALVDDKGKEVSRLSSQDIKATTVQAYRKSWKRYSVVLSTLGVLIVLFVSVGVGTSTSTYCRACHGADAKVAAMQSGAHKNTSCVKCHESGGVVARYSVNSFQRIGHMLTGFGSKSQPTGYSTVPASSCLRCHGNTLSGSTVYARGVNSVTVSHKEFYDAGMQCSRCHDLTTANMTATGRGTMNTCLICHNDKTASSNCATCHARTPQVVVASSKPSPKNADNLVNASLKTQCYACHEKDAAKCDGCHGMRIPHPADFEDTHPSAVAKYGVSSCGKCHDLDTTSGMAKTSPGGAPPCTNCHGRLW